jgi:hypothetical protein
MPIRTMKLEEVARISPRLARKYSATQCLGPAAVTCAIMNKDRTKHATRHPDNTCHKNGRMV